MTSSLREALAGITYTILERKGFAVLTGDAGTGKTSLLNSVMGTLSGSVAYVGWIINPLLTASEFFEMALLDLGITDIAASKAQRIVQFHKFLLDASEENKTTVLIIDEAHQLEPKLLEEIRLLTNFEGSGGKLLQIILAGQTELDDLLERHDLRQLKQRVAVRLTVDRLYNSIQVGNYMAHRWNTAGATQRLPFGQDAVRLIDKLSRGIPRVINAICDSALLSAFADGTSLVSVQQINSVASDLRMSLAGASEVDADPLTIPLPQSSPSTYSAPAPEGASKPAADPLPQAGWSEKFGVKYRVRPS